MIGKVRKTRTVWTSFVMAVAAGVLLLSPLALAQIEPEPQQAAGADQGYRLTYTATFSLDDLSFVQVMGYDVVTLEDGSLLTDVGQPMLPVQPIRLALPPGMAVTGVSVVDVVRQEIAGEYTIFPAQPPRRVSDPADEKDFVAPDAATYASAEAYPAELAQFSYQTDLAGQSVAVIGVCPVQYSPRQSRLELCTSLTVVVEGVAGYECGDYLPLSMSAYGRTIYEQMLTAAVVNAEDVELRTAPDPAPRTIGVDPGDYDYVIITQSSWADDFQPLADWKTKKGVPATVVTTSWIYNQGGYSGNNQSKIRAFVQDARNTWGATFFLLGGDTDTIPHHTRYISGEAIPNDTYYADYDYDWTCEVHVGRASVRSTAAILTFISKVLTYETDPPLSNYAETAFFAGFDLYCHGSNEGEGCKTAIRNYYVPSDWTYRREYDSESGYHKSDVIAYLNQGNNLVNHIDHCGEYFMGTGYTNHSQGLENSDMDALYNGDRQAILYSIGCWPCAFDYTACIAEHFVQNENGGGVAFVGNTRSGWYSPWHDDYYSLRFDRYFFRSLFGQGHYQLGPCLSDHKNDVNLQDSTYQYIFTELTLLGDPELPIWTQDPESLVVTHYESLTAGEPTVFPVEVYVGGEPLYDATVCLWKDGEIYEIDQTDYAGQVSFVVIPATTGTMYVTVTKHDYLPYQGEAEVTEAADCVGDLDGDGDTDHGDLGVLLGDWGCTGGGCAGDLNDDGNTDHEDLGILLADWGCTP
jgi:hypothetical protein